MTEPLVRLSGKCSWFGGPNDTGVAPDEGLAFIYEYEEAPHLFLPFQPPDTTGLARRLNPHMHFIATRWDYDVTPRTMLLQEKALVYAPQTNIVLLAYPADWGPHVDTGRVADLSKGLLEGLALQTDDEVEVYFPFAGSKDLIAEIALRSEVMAERVRKRMAETQPGRPVPPLSPDVVAKAKEKAKEKKET